MPLRALARRHPEGERGPAADTTGLAGATQPGSAIEVLGVGRILGALAGHRGRPRAGAPSEVEPEGYGAAWE
jgi:hypothetical protein